ncbi:MAG TPA: DUF1015 domain-containing protein [Ktedonobacteraceae bacterium]|nr:DUF1015 domain-containing protein [Ktedonobacteraceae bacterium]
MADVQPLRGLRYSEVGNLADVLTPPYDVISEEAQARYYARHPYNIIRLELGRDEQQDSALNNRYTRAAAALAEWRTQGVLHQENAAGYYVYQQAFAQGGQRYTRTSLLARVRLEPWSARVILPHEHTLAKPKDDRLKLLEACAANLSPIMSLYDDPQGRMRRLLAPYAANAGVQIVDEAQEEHRLQPITDAAQIELIQDFFSERRLYIADGHHRYETALKYREEILAMRKHLDPGDAVNFAMMALIDLDDPGLLVLPTHRLVRHLSQEALANLSNAQLGRYFTVREMMMGDYPPETPLDMLAQVGEGAPAFVICTAEQGWLVSLNEQGKARMEQSGQSAAWNALDVAVAHTLALEALLGLNTDDMAAGTHVSYTRDARAALQAVRAGEAQAAILLNPTRVRQICDVAEANDRMPQKSTYFYPKLITGLVMNPLW